jgi:hypothetical protein
MCDVSNVRAVLALLGTVLISSGSAADQVPVRVGRFAQQIHQAHDKMPGLSPADLEQCKFGPDDTLYVKGGDRVVRFDGERWIAADSGLSAKLFEPPPWYPGLTPLVKSSNAVRDVAKRGDEIAVAADSGLYVGNGDEWTLALPVQGKVRWAPHDVRAVAYDQSGQLWFASPQGVGCRIADGEWRLYTGDDGLPFADFTCMASGPNGVWFGTTNGAIRFSENRFEFRQGRRWLLGNHVRDIAVGPDGTAWFVTSGGVSRISSHGTSLADKAEFYLAEIDRHHRYTSLGYVSWAYMDAPGAKSTAAARYTDNDGHYTGKYLAAVSLGYGATKDPKLRADAKSAFQALAFLSHVTEGGTHPAPKGFIARTVQAVSEPDPNLDFDHSYDLRRNKADSLWKLIQPRWPVDETGEWYWKCDSSSDELDGHFFGYGTYYDHVCESEEEKEEVRVVVRRIADHLREHNWCQVDHDGLPTRWGDFSPEKLNQNQFWWVERGLKSLSILTYLSVTHHITEDKQYRDAFWELAWKHGYAMNGLTQPKAMLSPGAFGQGDDSMAFMNYYHLLRYETDPALLDMFSYAVYWHWQIEQYERNPLFNMIYAACNRGTKLTDQWGAKDLSPTADWLDNAVFTLKKFPLDLVDWPMSNAHRIDIVPLRQFTRGPGPGHIGTGSGVDGYTIPIDENHAVQSGQDPWVLTRKSDGTRLNTGVSFLLAYYMARVHGFIAD